MPGARSLPVVGKSASWQLFHDHLDERADRVYIEREREKRGVDIGYSSRDVFGFSAIYTTRWAGPSPAVINDDLGLAGYMVSQCDLQKRIKRARCLPAISAGRKRKAWAGRSNVVFCATVVADLLYGCIDQRDRFTRLFI